MFVTQILSRSESIDLEYWPIMGNPCISTYQPGLICKSALQCFLSPGGIYHLETGRVEFLGRSPKHQDRALLHWVYSNALLQNYERLDWIIPRLDHGFKLRYITQFDDFDGYIVASDIFEELRQKVFMDFGRSPSFFASRRLMHFVPLCSTLFQELLASKGSLPPSMQIPGHTFACGRAYWPAVTAVETAHIVSPYHPGWRWQCCSREFWTSSVQFMSMPFRVLGVERLWAGYRTSHTDDAILDFLVDSLNPS